MFEEEIDTSLSMNLARLTSLSLNTMCLSHLKSSDLKAEKTNKDFFS